LNVLRLRNGAAWVNLPGSVLDSRGADQAIVSDAGEPGTLDNRGTFKKTGGTGPTSVFSPVAQSGLLAVEAGAVHLPGDGSTYTGQVTAAAGTTVVIDGGTHEFRAGSALTLSTWQLSGGTVDVHPGAAVAVDTLVVDGGAVVALDAGVPLSVNTL